MAITKISAVLIAAALSTGCATRGANYVPLVDTKGHGLDQLTSDTNECQAFARQRMDAAQGAVIGAVAGALFMAALAPRGYRNQLATQGAIAGGLGGSVAANDTQETITKRCLSGRGYNVLN